MLKDLVSVHAWNLDKQSVYVGNISEVRRTLVENRHQFIATIVMMGINRIAVAEGEIYPKLVGAVWQAERPQSLRPT